ncbi:hypothetical protein [Haladaptatus sp. DFWS20]|uniref:hypothetical protein n=1 Tax=Haladaptatus sp. DFWS20 TaxID=3403467 RepID=UPI003EBAE80F
MPESRIGIRRYIALIFVFLVLASLFVAQPGVLTSNVPDDGEPSRAKDVRIVSPNPDSEAKLWPFTSRGKSFDSLTLPINVVVRDHSSRVVSHLRNRRDAEWRNDSQEWQGLGGEDGPTDADEETVQWDNTTGAVRYTYVQAPDSRGGWVTESSQLHDGTYFGSRYHLRLYEGGKGNETWTAIQAHHEHWDWFRLRHSVGSLASAQYYLDSQFYGKWYVDEISRKRFANGGISDTDGWVSVVDLRPTSDLYPVTLLWAALLLGSVGVGESIQSSVRDLVSWLSSETTQRGILLGVFLLSLPLVVRRASIVVETTAPTVPVKAIAGVGYLVLVIGLPLAAVVLPEGDQSLDWFGIALLGLGLGFLLDYRSIGVTVLPIMVVLHRLTLLGIVGLLAVGGARQETDGRWNLLVKTGLVLWVSVLVWPLFFSL